MARSYRFLWQPKWLAGHALVLALAVTMVLLGRWQLRVSDRKHFDLQNFGYTLQWWAFTIAGVVFWLKILHDKATGRRGGTPQPAEIAALREQIVPYRRYVMPRSTPEVDSEVARYNAYLAALSERES